MQGKPAQGDRAVSPAHPKEEGGGDTRCHMGATGLGSEVGREHLHQQIADAWL